MDLLAKLTSLNTTMQLKVKQFKKMQQEFDGLRKENVALKVADQGYRAKFKEELTKKLQCLEKYSSEKKVDDFLSTIKKSQDPYDYRMQINSFYL